MRGEALKRIENPGEHRAPDGLNRRSVATNFQGEKDPEDESFSSCTACLCPVRAPGFGPGRGRAEGTRSESVTPASVGGPRKTRDGCGAWSPQRLPHQLGVPAAHDGDGASRHRRGTAGASGTSPGDDQRNRPFGAGSWTGRGRGREGGSTVALSGDSGETQRDRRTGGQPAATHLGAAAAGGTPGASPEGSRQRPAARACFGRLAHHAGTGPARPQGWWDGRRTDGEALRCRAGGEDGRPIARGSGGGRRRGERASAREPLGWQAPRSPDRRAGDDPRSGRASARSRRGTPASLSPTGAAVTDGAASGLRPGSGAARGRRGRETGGSTLVGREAALRRGGTAGGGRGVARGFARWTAMPRTDFGPDGAGRTRARRWERRGSRAGAGAASAAAASERGPGQPQERVGGGAGGSRGEAPGSCAEATASREARFTGQDQVRRYGWGRDNVMRVAAAERRNGSLGGESSEGCKPQGRYRHETRPDGLAGSKALRG
jgi:hypothetical protein